MTDLAALIEFVAMRNPGQRFNLFNWQNTGGWECDIALVHGSGSDPLTAVLNLIFKLKLTAEDFHEWLAARPTN